MFARRGVTPPDSLLKKKKVPLFDGLAAENESIESCRGAYKPADELTVSKDVNLRLQHEIEKMPVQYRTILTLYHLDEMSYSEISEILGMPDGTVKNYLFRARKLLKERLNAKYEVEELWQ